MLSDEMIIQSNITSMKVWLRSKERNQEKTNGNQTEHLYVQFVKD